MAVPWVSLAVSCSCMAEASKNAPYHGKALIYPPVINQGNGKSIWSNLSTISPLFSDSNHFKPQLLVDFPWPHASHCFAKESHEDFPEDWAELRAEFSVGSSDGLSAAILEPLCVVGMIMNHGTIMGPSWGNHWTIIGPPWGNHWTMIGPSFRKFGVL